VGFPRFPSVGNAAIAVADAAVGIFCVAPKKKTKKGRGVSR